jgi:hypothetical protein
MATGSWRGTNALLLGVFQVTLLCPGLRRTGVLCLRTDIHRNKRKCSQIVTDKIYLSFYLLFIKFAKGWRARFR